MKSIRMDLKENSYDICFGTPGEGEAGEKLGALLRSHSGTLAVCDRNINDLYKNIWGSFGPFRYVFPAGEKSKTLMTVMNICGAAAENALDRKSIFAAVGGGVTGDMCGFAASMYMRGVDYVQIPTSLLAMVDSSIGGKTGADLPEGKNLVGAFHQPRMVLIDVNFLRTLPWAELRNGMAEIVKYAFICDREFLEFLEKSAERFFVLPEPDLEIYEKTIYRCCEIKTEVVSADEKENGLRAILNFGHTFGHAIELLSAFQIAHGEAVAIGMSIASRLAVKRGLCPAEVEERLNALLQKFKLPVTFPKVFKPSNILLAMLRDKKNRDGKIRLILPDALGAVSLYDDVSDREILDVLEEKHD